MSRVHGATHNTITNHADTERGEMPSAQMAFLDVCVSQITYLNCQRDYCVVSLS